MDPITKKKKKKNDHMVILFYFIAFSYHPRVIEKN
jgi:hypothetical protein